MKRIVLAFILLIAASTLSAQSHRADTLNERLFDAKVREMVYRLNITEDQKPKFVSIYRKYSQEMIAAWGDHKRPERPTTVDEVVVVQKKKIERQQRAQAIRMRYVDEFATVLNASQLDKFFKVESNIQQKLKNRRNHRNLQDAQGNRHNKRSRRK